MLFTIITLFIIREVNSDMPIGISEFTSLMMNICSKYALLRTIITLFSIKFKLQKRANT